MKKRRLSSLFLAAFAVSAFATAASAEEGEIKTNEGELIFNLVEPTITFNENLIEWSLAASQVKNDFFTFELNGPLNEVIDIFSVKVPMDDFKNVEKLDLQFLHYEDGSFELKLFADGKEIKSLSKASEITIKVDASYLAESMVNGHEALKYHYKGSTFTFEVNELPKSFVFTNDIRTFTDIKNTFSKNEIEHLASRYILYGKTTDTFAPNDTVDKGEFATMLARSLGLKAKEKEEVKYYDTRNHYAKDAIQALVENGIIKEKRENLNEDEQLMLMYNIYNAEWDLTRATAIEMLYNVLDNHEVLLPKVNANFKDVDSTSDFGIAAGTLQTLQIFEGYNGYLNPNEPLTRAQAAKVLAKTLKLLELY